MTTFFRLTITLFLSKHLRCTQRSCYLIKPTLLLLKQFVGINVKLERNALVVSVYDKRREFSFEVIRYPFMCSLIPKSIPYAVFTGQLHRFYKICSSHRSYFHWSIDLTKTLLKRGCATSELKRKFSKFVWGLGSMKWKQSISRIYLCSAFNKKLGSYTTK